LDKTTAFHSNHQIINKGDASLGTQTSQLSFFGACSIYCHIRHPPHLHYATANASIAIHPDHVANTFYRQSTSVVNNQKKIEKFSAWVPLIATAVDNGV